MSPELVQRVIEGDGDLTAEKIKKITRYSCCDESMEDIKRFWRVLETFDKRQLKLYVKYVNGRTTLSSSTVDQHRVTYYSNHMNRIPITHTCFFEIDIGVYDDDDTLKRLLLYGMENSNEIAETGGAFAFADDDI